MNEKAFEKMGQLFDDVGPSENDNENLWTKWILKSRFLAFRYLAG